MKKKIIIKTSFKIRCNKLRIIEEASFDGKILGEDVPSFLKRVK